MKKIAVAMSGGMDSTYAAIKLKEQGSDIFGITLQMFCRQHPADELYDVDQFQEVKGICDKLGIPHVLVRAEDFFESTIIKNFCTEYLNGRTPNPCVLCNKEIKFGLLLEEALARGATQIATGHYASIEFDEETKRYLLKCGRDVTKDQSYFLWRLNQYQLEHTLFPLAKDSKEMIRKKVAVYNLNVEDKPESQEICFVPNDDYKAFLNNRFSEKIKPGNIIDENGNVLGEHKGFSFYTIGQRKGLGISAPQPLYVLEVKAQTNEIVVGPKEKLYRSELIARECNWIKFEKLTETIKAKAKVRYNTTEKACTIFADPDGIKVVFDEPQMSITPGQSVVFYDGEYVLGGGIIERAILEVISKS